MDRRGGSPKSRAYLGNLSLLLAALLVSFATIEVGYRLIDPFPYFDPTELARNDAGKLGRYDPDVGWAGVPGAKAYIVTDNNGVWVELNRLGFRDVEHDESRSERPALVFLGDSFTEGHEVEFGKMFPTLLRRMLPQYEVYVLARGGWATDQEYLAFKRWRVARKIARVVLMFCLNDIGDSNRSYTHRAKPQFRFQGGQLVLTNVPVPEAPREEGVRTDEPARLRSTWLKGLLYRSHFLHDVGFRLGLTNRLGKRSPVPADTDLKVTVGILDLLRSEVSSRGGTLLVAAIPAKSELLGPLQGPPYQLRVVKACRELRIEHLDLAPSFKRAWFRTYYRGGEHWNAYGHKVAAQALHEYLSRGTPLGPSSSLRGS